MNSLYLVDVYNMEGKELGSFYTIVPRPVHYQDLVDAVPEYMTYGQPFDLGVTMKGTLLEGEIIEIG